MDGKTKWYFPDGEIPPMGDDAEVYGHESLIFLNPNAQDAHIRLKVFWTDAEPTYGKEFVVKAERVLCIRATAMRDFLGNSPAAEGVQYALLAESDVPVIAQYGRLDVRQPNMAFYTTSGYSL